MSTHISYHKNVSPAILDIVGWALAHQFPYYKNGSPANSDNVAE
jgi:hypothetical protein